MSLRKELERISNGEIRSRKAVKAPGTDAPDAARYRYFRDNFEDWLYEKARLGRKRCTVFVQVQNISNREHNDGLPVHWWDDTVGAGGQREALRLKHEYADPRAQARLQEGIKPGSLTDRVVRYCRQRGFEPILEYKPNASRTSPGRWMVKVSW